MILSYPRVDEMGEEFGSEVSFKFKAVDAIAKMHRWDHRRDGPDDRLREIRVLVPGCCTIYVGREDFDIKADYNELLAKLKEFNEMFGL